MDRVIISVIERKDRLSAGIDCTVSEDSCLEPETFHVANTLTLTEDIVTDITSAIPDFFDTQLGSHNATTITYFIDKNKT